MGKQIKGIEGLSPADVQRELDSGGKFVIYTFCISVLVLSFKRSSDVYFLRAGENGVVKGLPFSGISLIAGWWGIPWGPIWTIGSFITNFQGGKDVTADVVNSFRARA